MNSTSLRSTNGTSSAAPSNSDRNPEQSMKRSAPEATGLRGLHVVDVTRGALMTSVTSSTTWRMPSFADAVIAQEPREPPGVQVIGVVRRPPHIRGS